MRRALLTRAAPSVPISVGIETTGAGGNTGGGFRIYLMHDIAAARATGTGTLTNLRAIVVQPGTFAIFTYNPTTMLVRDISANLTEAAGSTVYLNYALAGLAVNTGDLLGFWSSDGVCRPRYLTDAAHSYDQSANAAYNTKPTAGTSLTTGGLTNVTSRMLQLYATN